MLLLSKTRSKGHWQWSNRLHKTRERRIWRNVKCNRLIGLFTACKLCLYKKRQQQQRSRPQLFIQYKEKSHVSLSFSLSPRELRARTLTGLERIRRSATGKKRKNKCRFPPLLSNWVQPLFYSSCPHMFYLHPLFPLKSPSTQKYVFLLVLAV